MFKDFFKKILGVPELEAEIYKLKRKIETVEENSKYYDEQLAKDTELNFKTVRQKFEKLEEKDGV